MEGYVMTEKSGTKKIGYRKCCKKCTEKAVKPREAKKAASGYESIGCGPNSSRPKSLSQDKCLGHWILEIEIYL